WVGLLRLKPTWRPLHTGFATSPVEPYSWSFMSRFATRITVSSAWAGMLQSRLAARAANASLIARSLGDWWHHHAAVNMQTVPSRASPFGLERLVQRLVAVAESRQQRAETRRDARRSF